VPILIDGHNLIGRLPTISLQDPDDEEKLVRLLRSYRARTGKALSVVFDPGPTFSLPQTQRGGGVEVVFAAHGSSADAVIARRVRRSRNPQEWRVVTSDAELAATVAGLGARVQASEEFAAELAAVQDTESERADVSLSPDEVEAWLSLFQDRDNRDALA
jgi:predicted RNA-binding protein with PIN domain